MSYKTLVISNIPWEFVWQRHQTLATLFADRGEVMFCEVPGIRGVRWGDASRIAARMLKLMKKDARVGVSRPALRVVRPWLLPATNARFHAINAQTLRRLVEGSLWLKEGVDLILNYSPSRSALELIGRVNHAKLIYDCTDNWAAVRGIPSCLREDEASLLGAADLTFVPSRTLESLKRGQARRIVRIPHGAIVENFRVERKIPDSLDSVTLLYYGHLHEQHFDFAAIDLMAAQRPSWKILLVGPVKTRRALPRNVVLIEQQRHDALKTFIQQADVLLLPYAINEYTRCVMPAKTFECLATGRPIVAAPLPELVSEFSPYLTVAESSDVWAGAVEKALRSDSEQARSSRIALAEKNSWQARFAQILELLNPPENDRSISGVNTTE